MLIKIIQKNAEARFLEVLEERCKNALHMGNVLICAFSQGTFKPEPDQILALLKDILRDNNGELYFCKDGDLIIYWKGRIGETSKALVKTLRSHLPPDSLPLADDDTFKLFEMQNQAEELRIAVQKKIGIMGGSLDNKTDPLSPPQQTKLELSAHQRDALQKVLSRRPLRPKLEILIVEDQDFSRKLLMGLLQREHVCFGARNAFEAIHYFAEHAPDIIFLDIELPDQDGHGLAGLFKKLDPQTYIVMVTGNSYKKDVEKARENQVHGFIAKPYSKQSIFNAIDVYSKSKLKRSSL